MRRRKRREAMYDCLPGLFEGKTDSELSKNRSGFYSFEVRTFRPPLKMLVNAKECRL